MNEREQIEQAIVAQEGLRATLGDAVVDATIAVLQEKLEALAADATPEQQEPGMNPTISAGRRCFSPPTQPATCMAPR